MPSAPGHLSPDQKAQSGTDGTGDDARKNDEQHQCRDRCCSSAAIIGGTVPICHARPWGIFMAAPKRSRRIAALGSNAAANRSVWENSRNVASIAGVLVLP